MAKQLDNRDFLNLLKRLALISLLQKDKFGTSLLTGNIFLDSRLSYMSKVLPLVINTWDEFQLQQYIPEDIDWEEFGETLSDEQAKYLHQETYLHITYKQVHNDGVWFYELPVVGKYEYLVKEKTRVYYNLIPDKVVYVLQRLQLPKTFITKYYLYCTTNQHEEIHTLLKKSNKVFGGIDESSIIKIE